MMQHKKNFIIRAMRRSKLKKMKRIGKDINFSCIYLKETDRYVGGIRDVHPDAIWFDGPMSLQAMRKHLNELIRLKNKKE